MNIPKILIAMVFGFVLGSGITSAAPTVHFTELYKTSDLGVPRSELLQAADGCFYGTTTWGGNGYGGIFKLDGTGVFSVLHYFAAEDGIPYGGLVQTSDGMLYGGTYKVYTPGTNVESTHGVIYRISLQGDYQVLHRFNGLDGSACSSSLTIGRDGNLYGTTIHGGSRSAGTIFKITTEGVFTHLHSFGEQGVYSEGSLIQANDGNFYGTTTYGSAVYDGSFGNGTVYKMTPEGVVTILHSFVDTADGTQPRSRLVQGSDGFLYGTLSSGGGGFDNCGTIFKINLDGVFTVLHRLTWMEGAIPLAGLSEGPDHAFYGTTSSGANSGTVFKITSDGVFTRLHAFYGMWSEDSTPLGSLILGSDGYFYGTTSGRKYYEALVNGGTVYKITSAGGLGTIRQFQNVTSPVWGGALTLGDDGDLYGTTSFGGDAEKGTLFKLANSKEFVVLEDFLGVSAGIPNGNLVLGDQATLYGRTWGCLFKLTTDGIYSPVHWFDQFNGGLPESNMVMGENGNFYGTTLRYLEEFPLFYSISRDGACQNIPFPYKTCTLTPNGEGAFIVTTAYGGPNYMGEIHKFYPDGACSDLYSFDGINGSVPSGNLVQGSDGNYYGVTYAGGNSDLGTFYRLTPDGVFSLLHSFDQTLGGQPFGGPIQASDGAYYGTTTTGGLYGCGTIYKALPSGEVETLYHFKVADGAGGQNLVQGIDGGLYGIANGNNLMTVFRLAVSGMPTPVYAIQAGNALTINGVAEGATGVGLLTVRNIGNSPVTLTGFSCPEGFTCVWRGTLPAGLEQDIPVTFSPTEVKSYTGTMIISSTAKNGPITTTLSGTSIAPIRNITLEGNLAFAEQPVETLAARTLTIRNDGNSPLIVSGVTTPTGFSGNWTGSIPAGGAQNVTIYFSPLLIKEYSGTIRVNSNATAGNSTRLVSGTGIEAIHVISLSGDLAFGEVPVGLSSQKTLTINNSGNSPLTVTGIVGPECFRSNWTGSIPAGASQDVEIFFEPGDIKAYAGILTVNSDATAGDNVMSVSGTGISTTSLLGDLNYGNVPISTSAQRNMTISNSGSGLLTVTGILYPSGYSGNWTGTIPPGGSKDVLVAFTPTAIKTYKGKLFVNSDAANGTNTKDVSGKGITATRIIALKGNMAFGNIPVGKTAQRKLTISNTGNAPLMVSGIIYPKGFTGYWTGTIPAGGSQIVGVTFSPTRKKTYSGNLTVLSDRTSGTNTKAVSGTGK